MPRYAILDADGVVVNTIIAAPEFVEAAYPGQFVEVPEEPAPEQVAAPATLTQLQFRLLLTQAERLTVRQKRTEDAALDDFLDLMDFATEIDLSHPLTIGGLTYASSIGCFTAERLVQILAGEAP